MTPEFKCDNCPSPAQIGGPDWKCCLPCNEQRMRVKRPCPTRAALEACGCFSCRLALQDRTVGGLEEA